jgi:phosphoenolpyruvate carboxylase
MSDVRNYMSRNQSAADKDAPLRYDIRLLGRILGDTVRSQEGNETFEIIERIRLTALRFHRSADASAGYDLQTMIKGIGNGEAIRIIRAMATWL